MVATIESTLQLPHDMHDDEPFEIPLTPPSNSTTTIPFPPLSPHTSGDYPTSNGPELCVPPSSSTRSRLDRRMKSVEGKEGRTRRARLFFPAELNKPFRARWTKIPWLKRTWHHSLQIPFVRQELGWWRRASVEPPSHRRNNTSHWIMAAARVRSPVILISAACF